MHIPSLLASLALVLPSQTEADTIIRAAMQRLGSALDLTRICNYEGERGIDRQFGKLAAC